jgi:hypothetical protein
MSICSRVPKLLLRESGTSLIFKNAPLAERQGNSTCRTNIGAALTSEAANES